jgi:hypothetical protein
MRQAEAVPVSVADTGAQTLLKRLSRRLYESILDAIHSSRDGIDVGSITIRSFKSHEDAEWEELVFGVNVHSDSRQGMDYANRIGRKTEELMDQLDDADLDNLVRLVSVSVNWS